MGKQTALFLTTFGKGPSQANSPSLTLDGEGPSIFECPSYTTPFSAKRLWGKARKRPAARAELAQAFPLGSFPKGRLPGSFPKGRLPGSPGALRRGASLWLGRGGYSGFDSESDVFAIATVAGQRRTGCESHVTGLPPLRPWLPGFGAPLP